MMSQTIPDPFFNTQSTSFITQDDYLAPFMNHESVFEISSEAEAYRDVLNQQSIDGLMTLREMVDRSGEDEMIVKVVYGIITEVYESDISKYKHIKIVDPTMEDGIEIMSLRRNEAVKVQQMVKFANLELQSPNYVISNITNIQYIPLFMYNYSEPPNDSKNCQLRQIAFKSAEDIQIGHKLEEWYSNRILSLSLSNLPPPGPRTYVNLCCQVVAYNKSSMAINALVWDTTTPKHTPTPWNDNHRYPTSLEVVNFVYFPIACGKYFPVTIWKGQEHLNHYDIFKCLTLENHDDLVVLFNIEVKKDDKSNGIALSMRSSRRYGKAVRVCRPSSLIGKLFSKRIEDYREKFYTKIGVMHTYLNCNIPNKRVEPSTSNIMSSTVIEKLDPSCAFNEKDLLFLDSIPGLQVTIETNNDDADKIHKNCDIEANTNANSNAENISPKEKIKKDQNVTITSEDQIPSDDESLIFTLPIKRVDILPSNSLNSPKRYTLLINIILQLLILSYFFQTKNCAN